MNQCISKKKTNMKKSLDPVFNESFIFVLPTADNRLADIQLQFVLLDTKKEVRLVSNINLLVTNQPL